MKKIFTTTLILTTILMASCGNKQPVLSDTTHANDPYEGWNRGVFAFNKYVDEYALEPVSIGYNYVTPKTVRYIIRNELNYLRSPVNIVNAALQGDWEVFKHVSARFFINSFVGGLGTLDAAKDFGFPEHNEDFGQTLAIWGVSDGRYYMAPFIGPLTLRDLGGKITDYAFEPTTYYDNAVYLSVAKTGLGILDFRANNADVINGLKNSTQDYYAAVRSIYLQKRNSDIMNEDLKSEDNFVDFNAE